MSKPKLESFLGNKVLIKGKFGKFNELVTIRVLQLSDSGLFANIEEERGGSYWVNCNDFNQSYDFYDTVSDNVKQWTYNAEVSK